MSKYLPGVWCPADPDVVPEGLHRVRYANSRPDWDVSTAWSAEGWRNVCAQTSAFLVTDVWAYPTPSPKVEPEWSHDAGEIRFTMQGDLLVCRAGKLGVARREKDAYIKAALDSHAAIEAEREKARVSFESIEGYIAERDEARMQPSRWLVPTEAMPPLPVVLLWKNGAIHGFHAAPRRPSIDAAWWAANLPDVAGWLPMPVMS